MAPTTWHDCRVSNPDDDDDDVAPLPCHQHLLPTPTTLRKDGTTGDNDSNDGSNDSNGPFPLQVREGFFPS
jgi:hypothetical protein